MNNKKRVAAYTLGCKVNAYDTEAVLKLFLERGYEPADFDDFADVYIINTCTVTNLGDKKSRQIIRRAKARNNDGIVVAMGCYAQVSPDEVSNIEGVNIVVGTKDRAQIVDMVEGYCAEGGVKNIVSAINSESIFEELTVNNFENRTRAFLKIQEGCNQFCSYCIIPYARGRVRSREPKEALKEVRRLADNGFKEVVLTGIHVSSFGKDLEGTSLIDFMKAVHEVKGIERIRLSSIEPTFITEQSIDELKGLPKVCDHFHLSLQSGCNKTLKRMNRNYTAEEYEYAVGLLRSSYDNVSVTTDIIVGFPGESEEDFLESYNFAEKTKLSKIHVFPYSKKKGTRAALMPEQLSASVKNERSKRLITLSEKLENEFRQRFVGKRMDVLYEAVSPESVKGINVYTGHTTNYLKQEMASSQNVINKIISTLVN